MKQKNTKIYFAGAIRGGRADCEIYKQLIAHLKNYGHVLTIHIGDPNLTNLGEQDLFDEDIYKRNISCIKSANVFIAEISIPSLGVGYEIAKAEELDKKILCLYRKHKANNKPSAMIAGNKALDVRVYKNLDEAFSHIKYFFLSN